MQQMTGLCWQKIHMLLVILFYFCTWVCSKLSVGDSLCFGRFSFIAADYPSSYGFSCFCPPEHTTSSSVSKKPRLDQIPAANLDADDPLTDVCILGCWETVFAGQKNRSFKSQ